MKKILFILIPLLFLSLPALAAEMISGKVVGISDGDTVKVLTVGKEELKIRLLGIDAPEKKQDFGSVAKSHLSELIFGKDVQVEFKKRDRYGRILGKILLAGRDINQEMLRAGLAWHYKQYSREQFGSDAERYRKQEADARASGKGLWLNQRSAIAPWDFRKIKKRKG